MRLSTKESSQMPLYVRMFVMPGRPRIRVTAHFSRQCHFLGWVALFALGMGGCSSASSDGTGSNPGSSGQSNQGASGAGPSAGGSPSSSSAGTSNATAGAGGVALPGAGGNGNDARGGNAAIGGGNAAIGGAGAVAAGGASVDTGGGGSSSGAPGSAGAAPSGGATIINDRFWKDSSGAPIYSQGGGVLQVGDTYYWYGVKYAGALSYAANSSNNNSDTTFAGITTYSSKDLVNWKLEATDMPANTSGWFGRLGVAYNATSKKYVLIAQGNGGLYFATSNKPNGGFVYDSVQTNLPGIVNGATGDQTIFQDDDGQAYLVSSSSNGRANRYVSPLRAADFLAAENAVLVYKGGGREGNCMFKYNGTYTFCSSDLHGWNSSQSYCVSASNIKGPYGAEFVLDGTEKDFSHVTQTGFFIAVKGTQQTTIIFAGDRWSDFAGNGLGYNQWLPLSFSGTTPHFNSLSAWTLDVSSGTWAAAAQNNWLLNPSFEADRVAVTTPTGWVSSGGSNSSDGRTGNWSWQVSGNGSLSQSVTAPANRSYALSVWTKSSASGATLYAKLGSTTKSVVIPSSSSWTNVTLSGIAVNDAALEVGITSSGSTVKADDFTLTGE